MQINTGIEIPIERDGAAVGILRFDPTDVIFAERIYDLLDALDAVQAEYEQRAAKLDANQMKDKYGIPINARERLRLLREACETMHGKIDEVFGTGTSEMVFGNMRSLDAIEQFFEELSPCLEEAQRKRIEKYTNRAGRRTALKK